MNIRLFKSGTIVGEVAGEKGDEKKLVRRALLVYEGKFASMDGEVDVTSDHLKALAENHNADYKKLSAGGALAMKDCPPVQVDHSTSGWDTVGRLIGPLEIGEYDGKVALYGTLLFLGSDAVDRVLDGRWTHLSLGADLEAGKMSEMTVTPFPAAPKASLLKHGKIELPGKVDEAKWKKAEEAVEKEYGTTEGHWGAVTHIYENMGGTFSKGESMNEEKEKMKKHLMEHDKMSSEEAEEKLSKMTDDEKKELSAKCKDGNTSEGGMPKDTKQMSAAKKAQLSALKEKITELSSGAKAQSDSVKNLVRSEKLNSRVAKLRAAAKISPAEQKELSIEKLSKLPDEAIDLMFEVFEKRSPMVAAGTYGISNGEAISRLAIEVKDKGLLKEMAETMRFSKQMVTKLAEGDISHDMPTSIGDKIQMSDPADSYEMPTSMDVKQQLSHHLKHLHHMKTLMEAGSHEEAKEHLHKMIHACHMAIGENKYNDPGTGMPETHMKHLSSLAKEVEKLQNQIQEVVNLASPLLVEEE